MATRNLTSKFLTLRASRSRRYPSAIGSLATAAAASVTPHSTEEQTGRAEAAEKPMQTDGVEVEEKPLWVQIHDDIVRDLTRVRENITSLTRLHAIRLKVSFGEGVVAEQERDIDHMVQQITALFRRCEAGLKQIAIVENDGTLTTQERTTRLNVMRSLAGELQHVSKQFRLCQKEYLKNLRVQQRIGEQFLISSGYDDLSGRGGSKPLSLDDALASDSGLTEAQTMELAEMEAHASQREKEILRIAQNVNELSTLFRELNMLVIEQGTVLDRIDYNIETSLTHIKKGVVHLEEAEKTSRKALATKCIIILAIVVLLLLIVFIWKMSSNN